MAARYTTPALYRRASNATLAALCQRMATSLDAGLDLLRVWRGEAERAHGRAKEVYADVAERIVRGEGLTEAVRAQRGYFPRLFVEMTDVGETTGTTPDVYRRLAEHYEHLVRVRRDLLSRLAWPAFQLSIAVAVVGLLIMIGGVLDDGRGEPIDILGLGLTGSRGLVIYANVLIGVALLSVAAWVVLSRFSRASAAACRLLAALPVIGPCLDKLALARVAWALHLMLNVQMDIRRVAETAMSVSGDPRFRRAAPSTVPVIEAGLPLSAAYAQTGLFPRPFIEALEVAEESGTIVESMRRLAAAYQEESQRAIDTLGVAAGVAVWLLVAGLIISLVFRVFGFYTGVLYDALEQV